MNGLLVLIDLQKDFLADDGLEPAPGALVSQAARLLEGFRQRSLPVAHVHTLIDADADNRMPHWRDVGIWRCVRGTDGASVPDAVAPRLGEAVIEKAFYSGFLGGALDREIREKGVDTIVIGGVHGHGCIRQTALDAYQRGLQVLVVEEAVGSYDPLHAAISKQYLDGRAARFVAAQEVLALLDEESPADSGQGLNSVGRILHRSPRDPSNEMWSVRCADAKSVQHHAQAARQAQVDWSTRKQSDRANILRSLVAELRENDEQFVQLMAREVGKPIRSGEQEVELSCKAIGSVLDRFTEPSMGNEDARVRRRPLGVVAAVTPWNNPIYIPIGKIVPALLFGNAVVWKPSPHAYQSATKLKGLFESAGLPDGVLRLVAGGSHAAQTLMRDASVDAVAFTGSSVAGHHAQAICALRRIPLQAELGGNNAAIVWADADIEAAARAIALGAFGFAGQRCTANRRVVVHESISDVFVEVVEACAGELPWGDPLESSTIIGPLISEGKWQEVEDILGRAQADGGLVMRIRGGWRGSGPSPHPPYCAPAIVVCDDRQAELVQEETFAPVLVVQKAGDWDHAMELCNGVRQGLAASLFSNDPRLRERFAAEAQAGILKFDQSTAGAAVDVPFGGWKSSGIGPPEHGQSDLDFYTRIQVIYR